MDNRKIDAVLAAALDEMKNPEERALPVFIHTAQTVDPTATTFLREIGVKGATAGKKIFTATLSPRAVEELSKQPWVRYVKLSQKLRMVRSNPVGSTGS
jgi:hypothetical protein